MDFPQRRVLDESYVSEMVGKPVKNFSLSAGAKKGDNVIAKLLTLVVETDGDEEETLHVLVKSMLPLTGDLDPMDIATSQFFKHLAVFPTEIAFFKQLRPLLQEISGYPSGKPKFYSAITDVYNDCIAMQDLRPEGFKMVDKKAGLSFQEVTKTLQTVALLHAHSYFALKSNNSVIHDLKKSILGTHIWDRTIMDVNQSIFLSAVAAKLIELLEEIGDETAAKANKFAKTAYNIILDLWKKTETDGKYFRTVVHGDLWCNNILYKHAPDGETVEEAVLIDWQQCRFGNIYEDLHYFIFTSTTAEFRKNHLKASLQCYFKEFASILNGLGCPLPTGLSEDELIASFYENIEYGYCYNLIAIPFQLGEAPSDTQEANPSNQNSSEQQKSPAQGGNAKPPSVEVMLLESAHRLKLATKNSPIAILRLQELNREMVKLNIL